MYDRPQFPLGRPFRNASEMVGNLMPAVSQLGDAWVDDEETQKMLQGLGEKAGGGLASALRAREGSTGAGAVNAVADALPGLMKTAAPFATKMAGRAGMAGLQEGLAAQGAMLGAPGSSYAPALRRQNMMMSTPLPPMKNRGQQALMEALMARGGEMAERPEKAQDFGGGVYEPQEAPQMRQFDVPDVGNMGSVGGATSGQFEGIGGPGGQDSDAALRQWLAMRGMVGR